MSFEAHPAQADVQITDRLGAKVSVEPRRKKVALIGFATNTMHLVPWFDPEYELWGLNQGHTSFRRRADRWFEMHQPEYTEDVRDPNYLTWLASLSIPVYMIEPRDEIPSSVRFPIEAAIQLAGRDYFTSTIAYMIALALLEGFEAIDLYGINLAIGTEYYHQKACAEWWIGFAEGRGKKVYVPRASAMLKQFARYGYSPEAEPNALTKALIEARIKLYRSECEQALNAYHIKLGALREDEALLQAIEGQEHGADLIMMPQST